MKENGISSVRKAINSKVLNSASQPSWEIYNLWRKHLDSSENSTCKDHEKADILQSSKKFKG